MKDNQIATVAEFENKFGYIVPHKKPETKISEREFLDLEPKVGVDHEERIRFLQANGYEVTRKNMIDSSLEAKG